MGARSTNCLECGAAVSLIDGEPVVRDGVVGLRCRACPAQAEVEVDVEVEVAAEVVTDRRSRTVDRDRDRRDRRWTIRAVTALVVTTGVAATGLLARGEAASPPELATIAAAAPEVRLARVAVAAPEAPLVHALTYSLTDEQSELPWVHPIAGARELPSKPDRRFGAGRPGNRPSECGGGHCGVDLGNERGVVVHAALGGRVIRVKRDAGDLAGRYVTIEHPQGLRSSYMHLDWIHPDLVAGMEIASGEAIGLLGASGIRHSPPHLHFTVERKGDSRWQYVDPEPMLTQAIVLDTAAPLPPPPPTLSLDLSTARKLPLPPAAGSSGSKKASDER